MQASRLFLFLICLIVPLAASSQTLTCSSNDMGRHYCRANTSNGVQMVHQRSGSACTQSYSWGYDGGGIWVDHGCRADFSLGGGGGNGGGTSPNEAMRWCKNEAGERMPSVPLVYISVSRGSDTGDGNYMINFRAQPPNARPSSGFCIIAKRGQLLRVQFDPGSGPNQGSIPGGGGHAGRMSPQAAMQSCKSQVSAWAPRVPLAYISINQANLVGGGGYMVPFQTRPPGMPGSNGFCNVSQAGQVEVWSGGRRVR
jgi:Protein of unknown function (DUF3011)